MLQYETDPTFREMAEAAVRSEAATKFPATGDAETVELAIEHQANIEHAVKMAHKAWNPPAEMEAA